MIWLARAVPVVLVLGCALAIGCSARGLGLAPEMQIELSIDGGFAAFPGLAKPILLDAADLSPELGDELKRLLDAALAEKRPRASTRAAAVPDGRRYSINIHSGGTRSDIKAADPMIPPAFDALMEFIKANGHR